MKTTQQSPVRGLRPLALAYLLLPLALGACQTAQMQLPETLAAPALLLLEDLRGTLPES